MSGEFLAPIGVAKLTYDYLGKRISVKLKSGKVATGTVGWYIEDEFDTNGVKDYLALDLEDVDIDGKPLGAHRFMSIPDSHIAAYQPLEPANTDEEMIAMGL